METSRDFPVKNCGYQAKCWSFSTLKFTYQPGKNSIIPLLLAFPYAQSLTTENNLMETLPTSLS